MDPILRAEITLYCVHLFRTEEYDKCAGVHYWPHVGHPDHPEHPCESGICTNSAKLIARKFSEYGAFVTGYPIDPRERKTLVAYDCYGHDFCVIGDHIVDWWAVHVEESMKDYIISIRDGVDRGLYKPRAMWIPLPGHALDTKGGAP